MNHSNLYNFSTANFPFEGNDVALQLSPLLPKQAEISAIEFQPSLFHDYLTGLYHRLFFEEEIKRLDNPRQLPISVIVCDINGLQRVNDLFGYSVGDDLLKTTASILKKCGRADDLMTRWDGDEFRILLPKTDNASVQVIINRIYKAFAKHKYEQTRFSISLGYATKTTPSEDIRETFSQAKDSMYKHKLLEKSSSQNAKVHDVLKPSHEIEPKTADEAEKILLYALSIGNALNLSEDYLNELKLLTLLYNIGSIGLTDKLLTQPCPLDEEQWTLVKKHPEVGFKIVKEAPHLTHVADSILYHHERWDGKGYPAGLAGNSIPLFSRILAVAEAFEAMTSPRAYRVVLDTDSALDELKKNAGTQFDPNIVEAFLHTHYNYHI